jgi:hypothetical protein
MARGVYIIRRRAWFRRPRYCWSEPSIWRFVDRRCTQAVYSFKAIYFSDETEHLTKTYDRDAKPEPSVFHLGTDKRLHRFFHDRARRTNAMAEDERPQSVDNDSTNTRTRCPAAAVPPPLCWSRSSGPTTLPTRKPHILTNSAGRYAVKLGGTTSGEVPGWVWAFSIRL